MALPTSQNDPRHLRAIVDMGSNGIRFSITDISPPTARILPTIYQHRVGISLYDAQYSTATNERLPIDQPTINAVIQSFQRFHKTCQDFRVQDQHITVLATEATRTAINSEDFRAQVKNAVGWDVTMLAKEEEGRVGAMGVASSLPAVTGLVMDLGGGSTQLTWLISDEKHGIRMPETGSVSLPYGAAALTRRLAEAEREGKQEELRAEVQESLRHAYASLHLPSELKDVVRTMGGLTLYLSGGGFRGWGYVLLSRHRVHPYPIPVINGFRAARDDFLGTDAVQMAAAAALQSDDEEIFRVSDRRASQVPAVAFLVRALAEVLPDVQDVRFCQGGVREGFLFSTLGHEVQIQHPLVVATLPFHSPQTSDHLLDLLSAALPPPSPTSDNHYHTVFDKDMLKAFTHLIYTHSSLPKDLQPSAAVRSTTSGILASVHGLLHESRAVLALLLCARWGGDVPPIDQNFKSSLEHLIEEKASLWWIGYLGAVAALVTAIYPSGRVDEGREKRLQLRSAWGVGKKQAQPVVSLSVVLGAGVDGGGLDKEIRRIEKSGKKKSWIGGREGVGFKVVVQVVSGLPG